MVCLATIMFCCIAGARPAIQWEATARVIPGEILEKQAAWKQWASFWNWAKHDNGDVHGVSEHFTCGKCEIAVPQTLPRHRRFIDCRRARVPCHYAERRSEDEGIWFGGELEAAIARYRFDDTLPERYLLMAVI
jgi:hypothetical protein